MAQRLLLVALALASALGAGCGREEPGGVFGASTRLGKDPATLYTNNGSEPEYLDPGLVNDSASGELSFQLFEGLTSYHPEDLHPTQSGAIRWEQSDDNRIYRFHLRPEAKWSDGKPVTAHDYAYSWKRVLRPATASRSSSNLYPLLNGELFNLGKLLVTKADTTMRASPDAGAAAGKKLAKGAAVEVLAKSPMRVVAGVPPLPVAPPEAKVVSYSKADAKTQAPEQLSFGPVRPRVDAAADGAWKGAEVEIVGVGGAVDCNGNADRWFELRRGKDTGFLPGCMLGPAKNAKNAWVLVAPHERLPTYDPSKPAPSTDVAPSPSDLGFLREAELVEDDSVVGVKAIDDLTLDVELERPTPYFIDLTSWSTLFPVRRDLVEAFEKRGEAELWVRPENIIVNGPYTLDTWKFRYELTMKPNPYYYDRDKLKLRRIVWFEVENYHSSLNLYKAGDVDMLGNSISIPSEYQPVLAQKQDFHRSFYLSIYWFEFNTKRPPVNDVRVRRALNLAVDKQQIVEKILHGGQIPATHYVPDFTGLGYADQVAADKAAGVDPFSTPDTVFNPERARALLGEAGYRVVKDGDRWRAEGFPPLEVLYNTSEGHRQIAVAVQDMWKRHLGVSVTLRNEEWKVMLKEVRDQNFQIVRYAWAADYNHPHTFLDTFLSSSPNNRTGWGDEAFDAMLRKASATPGQKESIQLYRKAEKLAVDGMARLPMYFYTKSTLVKPWVKGQFGHGRDVHLMRWLWIDPDWRAHPENTPAYVSPDFPPPGRLGQ